MSEPEPRRFYVCLPRRLPEGPFTRSEAEIRALADPRAKIRTKAQLDALRRRPKSVPKE